MEYSNYANYSKSNIFSKTYIFYGSLLVLLMATAVMVFLNNTINTQVIFRILIIFTIYLLLIKVGTDSLMKYFSKVNVENYSEQDDIFDLYENINDNEEISFLVIDPENGEIINANKGAEEFYGYSRDEFLSLNVKDLNILAKDQLLKKLAYARKRKLPISYVQHRMATGEFKEVEVYSGPVSIGSKELVYALILEPSMKRNLAN